MAYQQPGATTSPVGSSLAVFPFTHTKVYIAVTAVIINIIVAGLLSAVFHALRVPAGRDATSPEDYYADTTAPAGTATAAPARTGQEVDAPEPA